MGQPNENEFLQKADSETGQVIDAIQMVPNELISEWEIARNS